MGAMTWKLPSTMIRLDEDEMLDNIVWLFPAYRRQEQRARELEERAKSMEVLAERLQLRVAELEHQLLQTGGSTFENFFKGFRDNILSEEPYPDNKIPDNAWLTPEPFEKVNGPRG